MSEINRPKSDEELQAQVAAFASGFREVEDKEHVLKNLSGITAAEPDTVHRERTFPEFKRHPDGSFEELPKGSQRLVTTRADYEKYISDHRGRKPEQISRRVDLLATYPEFADAIDPLLAGHDEVHSRTKLPGYLSSGQASDTFVIEREGREYVARIPRTAHPQPIEVDNHVEAAVAAHNLPHLEQMVAVSYENGVTVSERMPGRQLTKLSLEEIDNITTEQLSGYIDTMTAAHTAGIFVDPNPDNVLVDSQAGFGIVDLRLNNFGTKSQTLELAVGLGARNLSDPDLFDPEPETADDFSRLSAQLKHRIPLLEKYREVCLQRFQGKALEEILGHINYQIKNNAEVATQFDKKVWAKKAADSLRPPD